MRIKDGFVMHQEGDKFVVDSVDQQKKPLRRRLLLNDMEAFIWKLMKEEISEKIILEAMLEKYNMDRKTAAAKQQDFFSKLETAGILEQDASIVNFVEPDMSRLREMRRERGYTQKKMEHLTGIDQSDYSKIENGRRYLSFEQCRRIALALHTSMDYLAGLTDVKEPYPIDMTEQKNKET